MKLLIIGGGPSEDELRKQAEELEIQNMVVFTGKVEHDELPPYYAACDLYITASLSDTNSISMLEAMATGLPVLHRYDPLNEGQVKNGINGYIYHDADEMYNYLIMMKNQTPDEREHFRQSVRDSVNQAGCENLANYLITVYTKAYEDVLKKKENNSETK